MSCSQYFYFGMVGFVRAYGEIVVIDGANYAEACELEAES